jgi:S1-C subfamily serine protease
MQNNNHLKFFVYLVPVFLVLFQSCLSTQSGTGDNSVITDNKYDSEFSNKSVSDDIERVSLAVHKLNVVAFYMTYEFPPGAMPDKSMLNEGNLILKASSTNMNTQSVAGTATVVYNNNLLLGMLTCNHIVDFPDTVVAWYRSRVQGIRAIAVKVKQNNFVLGLPDGDEVKIVAVDKRNDIAFLKQRIEMTGSAIKVLNYPLGKVRDLDWGSRVFIVGYPLGNLMVTTAIVSKPRSNNSSKFLTDAVFNQGISGSPVLAIRDGVPNFELVGMAASTSAKSIYFLKPADEDQFSNNAEVYHGDVVVSSERVINYGVTYSVTIDEIRRFLRSNKELLESEGFNADRFFK